MTSGSHQAFPTARRLVQRSEEQQPRAHQGPATPHNLLKHKNLSQLAQSKMRPAEIVTTTNSRTDFKSEGK